MKILFPDTSALACIDGTEFRQGEILKRKEPVIVPEYPWEGRSTYLYGSVLKRGQLYRMWYQSYAAGQGYFVNYARSADGITWSKPLMKTFCLEKPDAYPTVAVDGVIKDFNLKEAKRGSWKSNIVSTYHIPSVIYDPDDKDYQYKLFGYTDAGYCAAFSRDGMNFKEYEQNPVIPVMRFPNMQTKKIWFSDVAPAFRDIRKNRFTAFVKTYIIDNQGRTRRCVGRSESSDFKKWSKPETVWVPGDAEDRLAVAKGFKWADLYGLCGFNYGNGYLGFLWLFYIDHEVEKGTHYGKLEVYLAYSGNGKDWKRLSDEPFIPLSREGWDTGLICTSNAPLFLKDKILVYYGGSNFSHEETHYETDSPRHCIGSAVLRKDGFVYAYSNSGSLTTRLLKGERGRLTLNLNAAKGYVIVDVIKNGKGIKSFKVEGVDSISYTIRNIVKGDFSLRFFLSNSKLYSFEVN